MEPTIHRGGPIVALFATLLLLPAPAPAQETDEEFLSGGASEEPESETTAEDEAPEGDEAEAEEETHDRDHYFQGFVNLTFGTGWFLVAPYNKNDEDEACSEVTMDQGEPDGDPVCFGRSTMHLDILGGFAPLGGFEVFVMTRLGLEAPTRARDQSRWIGAGVKKYTPEEGLFKIGIGIAPLFAFSGTNVDVGYDFVIHVPIAFHFDFVKWFGAYLQIAPNISFVTEFRLDISGGIGVQGRFP
jgi:hypothetical protein